MIKSMTGFGKAAAEINNKTLVVELRSLNSKSLDLNLRLSSRYRDKESELRAELARQLERGKVDASVYFENNGAGKPIVINKELALAYHKELKLLATEIGQEPDNWLSLLTKMPDVLGTEAKTDAPAEEIAIFNNTVTAAIAAFNSFRAIEGDQLEKDLNLRLNNILGLLEQILVLAPARAEVVKARISDKLKEVAGGVIDNNRLEQELIYYLEKLDITEEQVRLRSHCSYFTATMSENANNGRKLGFITQEIGREINTIGSKANDADIQKCVVQMKDELEKVKEQLLNVL